MVLHDISMWFSSIRNLSWTKQYQGSTVAMVTSSQVLKKRWETTTHFIKVGTSGVWTIFFFLSDNIIKSGKYDWSLCYVSVGGSIFKAHTVDWVVNEGRQATVEKNSNFCLIWSEARWGVVLLQLSRLSIVILMNWLFCNSELNCGNSPNWFIAQRLEYQKQNGS